MEHNLSPRIMSLCQLINEGKTPAEASRITGYTNSYVCRLLKTPEVNEYLSSIVEIKHERSLIDATELLVNLDNMFNADFADIIDKDNNCFKAIHDMPVIWRKMVKGVKYKKVKGSNEAHITEITFIDRLRVLEMIGDHRQVGAFAKVNIHATMDFDKMNENIQAGRKALNALRASNPGEETPSGGQPPNYRGGIEELSEESNENPDSLDDSIIDVKVVE